MSKRSWPKKGSPSYTIVGTPQCPAARRARSFSASRASYRSGSAMIAVSSSERSSPARAVASARCVSRSQPETRAIPKERRDLSTEFEPSRSLVGRYPEAREATSVGLLLRNGQRLRVLFDRVGDRPSEGQAVKGGGAGAVLHEVRSRKGVHSCEVRWISNGGGVDDPQVDRHPKLVAKFNDARENDIRIGAAKRPIEVDD